MSSQEFAEVIGAIDDAKWQEAFKPTQASYTEFEISIAENVKFLKTLEHVLPQIYISLQYQIKDPKTDPKLRKHLSKKAMTLETTLTPGIDKVWKLSSKMTYVAMVNKMTMDRKKSQMLETIKKEG